VNDPAFHRSGAPGGLSAIVPVYNGEGSLRDLHARLSHVLERLAPGANEILFVEDRGRDGSWQVIRELAARDPRVRGIRLSRNFGQHNALLCGIRSARFACVATLDDDLQNPPEELPALWEKLFEGHDVVYGTPLEEKHGLSRDLASKVTKLALQNTMGSRTAGMVSAFRMFRAEIRESFAGYSGAYVNVDVLLTWGAARFAAVPVRHDARARGASNYTWKRLADHALNMLTGFSVRPLRLASLTGLAFSLLGFALCAYVVGRKLFFGTPVPGFPFLASTIALFSGVQLLSLGIIGEYLARMHFHVMGKPAYSVSETTRET
jgi:undecaprenyl-phosphate 4-deoxy-4-formamido-L-arabinose transferase